MIIKNDGDVDELQILLEREFKVKKTNIIKNTFQNINNTGRNTYLLINYFKYIYSVHMSS